LEGLGGVVVAAVGLGARGVLGRLEELDLRCSDLMERVAALVVGPLPVLEAPDHRHPPALGHVGDAALPLPVAVRQVFFP